jgi:hypothetical protein
LEVLKCDAGEGWMRSVGPIVWFHRVKKKMSILCTIKQRKANCICHVLWRNCGYWMTLRISESIRIWKRKHNIALSGELAWRDYGPVARQTVQWMNGLHKCQFIFRMAEVQSWAKTLAFLTLIYSFPPRKWHFCALKLVTTVVFHIHFHSLFIYFHAIQWWIL